MTSIAESTRPGRALAVLRAALLAGLLALVALRTPWPWAALWLAVPFAVAASLLLAWRFGAGALALPALLGIAAVLAVVFPDSGLRTWHVLWVPAASLTGAWMGLREEGGGPRIGERAWMHAPLLAAAFALPVLPGLLGALTSLDARARAEEQQVLSTLEASGDAGKPGLLRSMIEDSARRSTADRVRMLAFLTPNLVFGWMVLLVAAGRALASRIAAWRGWPALSSSPFSTWRLPDGALVPLLAGIALALFVTPFWQPSAAVLLGQSLLGYSVQGVAVAQSLMLARGVPPAFVLLVMVFLFAFTLPVFLPSVALLGVSDVWLDFRRIEPSPPGKA